ncbi:substrate-binding domain-containing protein [Undibacterium sp. Di27W]|uniref:substrate-binding domain-containing protein n=1 Tax=Undibacterium sp. Di27W TaxID=3413036 RepID=UPI003BEF741F
MRPCRLLLTIVATLSTLLLLACQDEVGKNKANPAANSTLTASAKGKPITSIALVMKTLTNPYYIQMEQGARRAAKEYGVELLVKTGAQETSIEQQIQIVDELIQNKVAAIVIAPGDSKRLVPILKKAQDQGIVIIDVDNRLDAPTMQSQGMQNVPFVGVDNEKASFESVKYAVDQIKKPTAVAILEGIRSTENSRLRVQGAEQAFASNKFIKLVAKESASWKIDEGRDVSKRLLAEHPEISLLYCANDMMALGAIKYLQDSGKTDVAVIGYDALEEAVIAIRQGRLLATVDQSAAEQGYVGIMLAFRRLKGDQVPPATIIKTRLVTADSLK